MGDIINIISGIIETFLEGAFLSSVTRPVYKTISKKIVKNPPPEDHALDHLDDQK